MTDNVKNAGGFEFIPFPRWTQKININYLKLKWNSVHQLVTNCTHLFLSKHQASHKESEMVGMMIRNITVREYWQYHFLKTVCNDTKYCLRRGKKRNNCVKSYVNGFKDANCNKSHRKEAKVLIALRNKCYKQTDDSSPWEKPWLSTDILNIDRNKEFNMHIFDIICSLFWIYPCLFVFYVAETIDLHLENLASSTDHRAGPRLYRIHAVPLFLRDKWKFALSIRRVRTNTYWHHYHNRICQNKIEHQISKELKLWICS